MVNFRIFRQGKSGLVLGQNKKKDPILLGTFPGGFRALA